MDYFSLFDLPKTYHIDLTTLTERYQTLQTQHHPDRFAKGSEEKQAAALYMATQINEAYQTLKQPLKRAAYLLSLQEVASQDETQTISDSDFLHQQFALHEVLAQLEHDIDHNIAVDAALEQFSQDIAQRIEQQMVELTQQLAQEAWHDDKASLQKLKFLEKLQQRCEALSDKFFDF